jgi:hypothetical protein
MAKCADIYSTIMKVNDYYNAGCAELLSQKFKPAYQDFQDMASVNYMDKNVADKDFSDRMDVFVNVLNYICRKIMNIT